MAKEIYFKTWWGNAQEGAFGGIYYNYILITEYISRVEADGGFVENPNCPAILI